MSVKSIFGVIVGLSIFVMSSAHADFQHVKPLKCKGKYYPQEALENRQEGNVKVVLTVNEKGKVVHSAVLESSGSPALDEAAVKIFSSCKYSPALQDGVPVEHETTLIYFWKLPQ